MVIFSFWFLRQVVGVLVETSGSRIGRRRQAIPVIQDPHRLQSFPGIGHPHDHRPPPMHLITTTCLPAHPSLTGASFVVGREHPESASGHHEERRPRIVLLADLLLHLLIKIEPASTANDA